MEPPTPEPSGKTVNCGVCHQAVLSTGWFDHVQDEAHTRHAPSYTGSSPCAISWFAYWPIILDEAFLWDSKQDKCGVHVEEETLDLDYVLLDRTEGPPSVTGTFHISLTFPQCVDLIEVCIGSNLRASGADRCPSW
ncbi:hypothetical protein FRC02_009359 [Tulasnella sp. 418]|nr:hypothetical protein FRC02_009359 [Tulasnella sp. 418]